MTHLEQQRAILSAVKDSHVTVIKGIAEVNPDVKTHMTVPEIDILKMIFRTS